MEKLSLLILICYCIKKSGKKNKRISFFIIIISHLVSLMNEIVDHMRQKRLLELKEYKKQINEIGKNQLRTIENEILLMFHL